MTDQSGKRQGARLRNVMIVGDFADVTGGQAKVAIDSARLLADAGIDVTFFAATGPVSPHLEHRGIRVVCLDQATLMGNPSRVNAMVTGLWNRDALSALRDEAARLDPGTSVLHCHGWAKALSPSVGRVLAGGPLPVLYTMHEYFLACPNGGFYDYRRQEICHRTPLSPACLSVNCDARRATHKAWRVARSALARGAGRLPAGLTDIAYISQTQLGAMRDHLPGGARLHRLPNPVAAVGAPVEASANEDFVFIGRLSPEKGAAQFAEAAMAAGVKAVFVGEGPEAERIRAINPEAEVTGWLDAEGVADRIGKARAVVFPSLWYECQPLVPVEALLRGVPVICGAWGAAAEVVDHGVNGIVYDKPQVGALAKALGQIGRIGTFDSDVLAAEMAPETHLRRLLEIYEDLLARGRS